MLSEQGKDEKKLCMSTSRYLTFPILRKRTKVNKKQIIVQTISETRIWRRDKSERRLRWQDKEHQLETESTKERFSWVLFKPLFLFQKAVEGLGISLAYHVPSKAQGIPNSVSQHLHPTYCGDFVQEEDFWFVSRVGDDELPDFFPVWIQKVTQELKIIPWCRESTWKNGSHVSVHHLSKWMRALPAVTMVPCNKASSCLSSKQESRAAIGLMHVEPEAPKSLISKQLWITWQVCCGLLLSVFWVWLWCFLHSLLPPPKPYQKDIMARYQI